MDTLTLLIVASVMLAVILVHSFVFPPPWPRKTLYEMFEEERKRKMEEDFQKELKL